MAEYFTEAEQKRIDENNATWWFGGLVNPLNWGRTTQAGMQKKILQEREETRKRLDAIDLERRQAAEAQQQAAALEITTGSGAISIKNQDVDKLKSLSANAQDAGLIALANMMPAQFMPVLQALHPEHINTTGSATITGNAIRDIEMRQQQEHIYSAINADAETAAETMTQLQIAAKKAQGLEVTEEDIAKMRDTSRGVANSLPAMTQVLQAAGVPQANIDAMMNQLYGQKGSTVSLFQKGYAALRPFMNSGAAAKTMSELINNNYGSGFSLGKMGGLSADDMGSVMQFLSDTGRYNKTALKDGFNTGLHDAKDLISDSADIYMDAKKHNLPLDAPMALAMGGGRVADEIINEATASYLSDKDASKDMELDIASELGDIDAAHSTAKNKAFKIEFAANKFKEYGGVDVDISKAKDKKEAKEQIKQMKKQADAAIKEAKKKGDDNLVEDLKGWKDTLVKEYESVVADPELADLILEKDNYMQSRLKEAVSQVSGELMEKLHEVEIAKRELVEAGASGDKALQEQKQEAYEEVLYNFEQAASGSPLRRTVKGQLVGGNPMEDAIKTGQVAIAMKDAYAAKGQDVSTAEVLAKSKALLGTSTKDIDLGEAEKAIGSLMRSMQLSGRSMESLLNSSAKSQQLAEAVGLKNTTASVLLNARGQQNYDYYIQNGVSAEEAQAQVEQDLNRSYNMAATETAKGMQFIKGTFADRPDLMNELKVGVGDLTTEDLGIINKIVTGRASELTREEAARSAQISRKIAKGIYNVEGTDAQALIYNRGIQERGATTDIMAAVTKQSNYYNRAQISAGLGSLVGEDTMKNTEDRQQLELIIASHANAINSASSAKGAKGDRQRFNALFSLSQDLRKAGLTQAADNLDKMNDGSKNSEVAIAKLEDGLSRQVGPNGNIGVIQAQADIERYGDMDARRYDLINQISKSVGVSSKGLTEFIGELNKANGNESAVMTAYTKLTGRANMTKENRAALTKAMVLSGQMEEGSFVDSRGQTVNVTKEDIELASHAGGNLVEWSKMGEAERKATKSGLWGTVHDPDTGKTEYRELTVDEAMSKTNTVHEYVNSKFGGDYGDKAAGPFFDAGKFSTHDDFTKHIDAQVLQNRDNMLKKAAEAEAAGDSDAAKYYTEAAIYGGTLDEKDIEAIKKDPSKSPAARSKDGAKPNEDYVKGVKAAAAGINNSVVGSIAKAVQNGVPVIIQA